MNWLDDRMRDHWTNHDWLIAWLPAWTSDELKHQLSKQQGWLAERCIYWIFGYRGYWSSAWVVLSDAPTSPMEGAQGIDQSYQIQNHGIEHYSENSE